MYIKVEKGEEGKFFVMDETVRRNSIDGGCLRKVYPLISIEHIMPQHLTPSNSS